jgi:hypothetical protein
MDIKNYVARIQLVNASDRDNLALDIAMGDLGFGRVIVGKDGTRYYLPSMEYIIWSEDDIADIKDAVKDVANSTGKKSFVLITQASAIEWDLPIVK